MLIRTDVAEFDTDHLLLIDRVAIDHVIVVLDTETLDLRGVAAQQAWTAITEQANDVAEIKPKRKRKQ